MFFDLFKEKKEALQENPEDKHLLPILPGYPNRPGFSQGMIKDAVAPEDTLPELPSTLPLLPRVITKELEEKEPWTPSRIPVQQQAQNTHHELKIQKTEKKQEDIFVKIEKFREAKKALETSQRQLKEIDQLLERLKELNNKEQEQISIWESHLLEVKSKVKEVSDNIFEKI